MKLLVLLSRVPYPLEKGDKLRAFHQIKRLSQNHEIILCCLNDAKLHPDAINSLKTICSKLEIINLNKFTIYLNVLLGVFNKKPLQVHYFYQKKAQKKIDTIIERNMPHHIYCQLIRVTEYVRKYSIFPKTLDYMDTFSKGMERRVDTAPNYLKPFFKMEANRLTRYEYAIFNDFDNKTIISEQDKSLISHPDRDQIDVIPNGVDTDFFQPINREKDIDIVFTGNMNYPPNIDSARYIAMKILPLLLKKFPNIQVLISGANPSKAIMALQSENIIVTGWVKDIRESYSRARIFLAPMQIGTGLQNKLLEAMAMKIPAITSDLANNALGAIPNKHLLIGNNPDEYVTCIQTLLQDSKFAEQMAEGAHQFVLKQYKWDHNVKKLEKCMFFTAN